MRERQHIYHKVLDEVYPDRWIGKGAQMAWPPRSYDLNRLDFYLWGHVSSVVHERGFVNNENVQR